MKPKWVAKVFVFGWFIYVGLQVTAIAGQTNQTKQASSIPKTIATNFEVEASLSASEIKQVLELAKANGIEAPAEVSTFHYLPVGGKGISVKSVDRIDGRNTSFDTVTISKKGWDQLKPAKNSKRVGKFWANAD